MRGIFGLISFVIAACAFGQDFSDFHPLSTHSEAMLKKTDSQILENAQYIMNHPANPFDSIRNDAMAAVLLWMMSTPDYTFLIDETIVPLIKGNEEILAIYMVAMTQFVLENPDQANYMNEIKLRAFTVLLAYCNNPLNNIEKSEAIAQAIYALRTGSLKEYLNISQKTSASIQGDALVNH